MKTAVTVAIVLLCLAASLHAGVIENLKLPPLPRDGDGKGGVIVIGKEGKKSNDHPLGIPPKLEPVQIGAYAARGYPLLQDISDEYERLKAVYDWCIMYSACTGDVIIPLHLII